MSDPVRIIEMGPRDGLQNEKTPVSVEARIAFVEALVSAGLKTVEVGAFVAPKAIPQMASSDAVLRGVGHIKGAEFHVLVPNEKGYDAARAAGTKVVSVFAAASEGFSRANINCTVAESIERFKPVLARAKADGIPVRGYISCVLGCPFDGEIKPKAVADLASTLFELGCYEISLGDTIGVGTPSKAKEMLRAGQCQRSSRQARDAFPRHLRPGARQSLCRDGGGCPRHRRRRGRPRRLPLCAGRDRKRRDRRRRLHARGHGDQDRCRLGQAARGHQRDERRARQAAREPRGVRAERQAEAGCDLSPLTPPSTRHPAGAAGS
ncbi:hypothetical protein ACVME9_005878 [Bradyrhizobium liaoningense]